MLISALCEYYDILAKAGKVLPDGYSSVKISYEIALTEAGEIDEIQNIQKEETVQAGKKEKVRKVPADIVMPKRTEKPGIDANIAEHRPLYIFGLNLEDGILTPDDRTGKAKKSHEAFVKENLEFTEGINSPLVKAYRNFLLNWKPEEQTKNEHLLKLGKDYGKSGFVFCLSGYPGHFLHEDPEVKKRWEEKSAESNEEKTDLAQCAVTGKMEPIARIHSKIRGVYGGLATGSVLISFKNESENSYGNEQSYNSNISENAMEKYTEALNYLLKDSRHKVALDDMTIVFWAMNESENEEELFLRMLMGEDKLSADQTEAMLREMLQKAREARISKARLLADIKIDPQVDFYMVGLKPNSSRLSVKFIIRRRYADVFWNIARFQEELQITEKPRLVSFSRMKREMISPKSQNEKANPALLSRLFETVIYGGKFPVALLETMVRRVRTDSGDEKLNSVRAGLIKAYLNRTNPKEGLQVALDKNNKTEAYLCGRLFAVLEKLQQDASGGVLNRTIKDAYFSSASVKPALIFPKLIRLAQNHLNKVKYPIYYNKLMGEIMSGLADKFPDTFSLSDQGRFIIGYYQQYQSFFEKSEKTEEE